MRLGPCRSFIPLGFDDAGPVKITSLAPVKFNTTDNSQLGSGVCESLSWSVSVSGSGKRCKDGGPGDCLTRNFYELAAVLCDLESDTMNDDLVVASYLGRARGRRNRTGT